jgi:DNA-binding CsgD family transcriptional regulator
MVLPEAQAMVMTPQDRDLAVLERAALVPIGQAYRQAIAESRRTRQPVGFRVDADPDGTITITPVPAAGTLDPPPPPSDTPQSLGGALDAARARGRAVAARIVSGPDMVSADDLAQRLGVSRMTVNTKRQKGQLLGLTGTKRGFRFPLWQLDRDGVPRPELPGLHKTLGSAWAVYRFLEQPHGALGGVTGRDALDRGMTAAVMTLAESIARGDFR